jgi:GNAT superfamily N-acetyltransferase
LTRSLRLASHARQFPRLETIVPEASDPVTALIHPVLIRQARRGELDAVAALIVAAYEPYRDGFPPVIFAHYLENLRDVATRFDHGQLLVAELGDGRLAGTITFYPDASREELGFPAAWAGFRALGVHPSARGLGLGRRLSDWCVAEARRGDAKTVGIHTQPKLVEASRIYERMGFRRCPEFDFSAATVLGLDPAEADLQVLAYRLDL